MQHISTLYSDLDHFQQFLEEKSVDFESNCIARIVTSDLSRNEISTLTQGIKKLLPRVGILGMTSSTAVIHNSKIEENKTMISLEFYDKMYLSKHLYTYKDKDVKEIAQEINRDHKESAENNATVQILFNCGFLYITELLAELNASETPVPLAGAVVGMLPDDDLGFVFDENGIYDDVIATYSLEGFCGYHYISTNVSYDILQDIPQEITKIEHDKILEVDGVSAQEWLFEYLGVTDYDYHISDEFLTHFPIVMEDGSSSRFLHYDPETKEVFIHHETSLLEGTKFKKGCISPSFTVENTHKSLLTMLDTPIESIFLCACFFRKIYLSNCIQWELKPFSDLNVCGMFAMGEIVFANGKNILHHGASIFTGIAEHEKYVVPQIEELADKKLILEATNHLHHLIEQAVPDYADDIIFAMSTLYDNFEIDYHTVDYWDEHLNIPNMLQYKKDKGNIEFSKICIIEVESADAIIAFMGIDLYYELCRETIDNIKRAFSSRSQEIFYSYCFNYKTIFFTCTDDVSDEEFIALNTQIHQEFEHTSSTTSEATVVLRFVLLSKTEDLIEDGIKLLFENRDSTETFLVNQEQVVADNNDIHMINLIKWALDHNKIIPYYQGLYNNETKTIDKYEALMRMEDEEGTVYTPYHFLDIAKKYKLYNKISLKMVEQVLEDFKNRREKISINLSFSDVQSDQFKTWFLHKLEEHPLPENITIEILETDDFKGSSIFLDFLTAVKSMGCKIAVDDFGTGYSTFVTVAEIEPDYVKIDGSIIQKIATDEKSRTLLDAIGYFSKKMNAMTVAEFVENEDIQGVLEDYNITYSQGYYFSKPSPLEKI